MAVKRAMNMTTARKRAASLRRKGLKATIFRTKDGIRVSSTR